METKTIKYEIEIPVHYLDNLATSLGYENYVQAITSDNELKNLFNSQLDDRIAELEATRTSKNTAEVDEAIAEEELYRKDLEDILAKEQWLSNVIIHNKMLAVMAELNQAVFNGERQKVLTPINQTEKAVLDVLKSSLTSSIT